MCFPIQSIQRFKHATPPHTSDSFFVVVFLTEDSRILHQCHPTFLACLLYLFHKTIVRSVMKRYRMKRKHLLAKDWRNRESRAPHCQLQPLPLQSKCVWVTYELWLHTLAPGPAPLTATVLIRMQTDCHNSSEAQVNRGANWVRHWVMEQFRHSMNALLKTVLLTASPQWNCIHEPFIPEQCTPHPAPASITKYHPEKASPPGC